MPHERRLKFGQSGALSRHALYVAAAVVIVGAAAVLLFYPRTGSPPESEAPTAAVGSARGDAARQAIAKLQSESTPPNYDAAYQQAQAFQAKGRLADAQLMYFFAARGGQAKAAFELGSMSDPNHFAPKSSLMKKPDPFQAYKWYKQAKDGGVTAAAQRLADLRKWTEQRAQSGDEQARQLLLQWE